MTPDMRNVLLVIGAGAAIGLLAVPRGNNASAPVAQATAPSTLNAADQELADLQVAYEARATALRREQLAESMRPRQPASAQESIDTAILRRLKEGATPYEIRSMAQSAGNQRFQQQPRDQASSNLAIRQGSASASVEATAIHNLPATRSTRYGVRYPQSGQGLRDRTYSGGSEVVTALEDSDRRYNSGAIDVGSGQYLAPAGPGSYVSTRDGTLYAPAGPNGVIDTRTGRFVPVAR